MPARPEQPLRRRRPAQLSQPVRRLVPNGLVGPHVDERVMLADYLKLLAWWLGRPPAPRLPPRLELALRCLLRGLSEKQIAVELRVSPLTVHEYVKQLHKRLGVGTRSELLARFLPSTFNELIVNASHFKGR